MSESSKVTAGKQGIIIDLDSVLLGGHQACFDCLCNVLKPLGVAVTRQTFSRYGLGRSVGKAALRLLREAGKDVEESAASAACRALESSLSKATCGSLDALKALVREAGASGCRVAFVSQLPQASAEGIVAGFAVEGDVTVCSDVSGEALYPSKTAWRRTADALGVKPRACIAVVASQAGNRSGLAARLSTVVIPDAFSAFQDLGGADLVIEQLDAAPIIELMKAAE